MDQEDLEVVKKDWESVKGFFRHLWGSEYFRMLLRAILAGVLAVVGMGLFSWMNRAISFMIQK